MTEGTPKAIEPKGITRNATKIGVQDGQAEDLINLRFMDGSWRASGNGRQIENMPTGTIYEQLYVHTNVYHHLLGVDNSVLYWFAEIDNDGVTFYPLDGTTDRSLWPEDKQDLPTKRVALTNVVGDIWITQTGHLLTVIDDGNDVFTHLVYKGGEQSYKEINADVNGNSTKSKIYPFGVAHFKLEGSDTFTKTSTDLGVSRYWNGHDDVDEDNLWNDIKSSDILLLAKSARDTARSNNRFNQPFLICVAVRLYDGSFAYASNPILLNPGAFLNYDRTYINSRLVDSPVVLRDFRSGYGRQGYVSGVAGSFHESYNSVNAAYYNQPEGNRLTVLNGGNSYRSKDGSNSASYNGSYYTAKALGKYIQMQLEDITFIKANPEIFQSVCIFVTREIETINFGGSGSFILKKSSNIDGDFKESSFNVGLKLPLRSKKVLINEMKKENFFLLREYRLEELVIFQTGDYVYIDINTSEYPGLLNNIIQKEQLPIEAFMRNSFVPKVVYNYNGRLHIANYRTTPWRGYTILNYYNEYGEGSGYSSPCKPYINVYSTSTGYSLYGVAIFMIYWKLPLAYIKITSMNSDGSTRVSIRSYMVEDYTEDWSAQSIDIHGDKFMGDYLNPLLGIGGLSDVLSIEIYAVQVHLDLTGTSNDNYVKVYKKTFNINHQDFQGIFSIYVNPNLLDNTLGEPIFTGTLEDCFPSYFNPIDDNWREDLYNYDIEHGFETLPKEMGMTEYFPNGLKVSKTDQPMFFPVENTYQVGSAEILALMSNTIAVGTGQTGDAPLYVFCKDGVYALYVDASGEMAYPNARILARDVCNNPRSVTPIDAGVVFTTDRGLMMIAGEQVQEIGAPAEGDVVQFWNAGSVDYSKIATASMQQIAGLPSELCSTTDFLTYLQDKGTSGKAAIINYNHNMRELMVSNPNYPYSYVLDREGNWSRRDYTASQYVNNYPTSYRVDADGHFYKVDDEGDAGTSLEHRKEADNKIFYLSNVIKLDSIGFKQAYRFVVRGYFETLMAPVERVERAILQKSIDSSNFYIEEDSHVLSQTNLPVMNHLVGMSDVTNGLRVGDVLVLDPIGNPLAEAQEIVITEVTRDDVYLAQDVVITEGVTGFTLSRKRTVIDHVPTNVACVVEGSYDGRKFKPLGYNRKSGKFRDIGCIVERTDVRFFRVCLSGQVTGKTRIDYMEMSAGASMLNTKIR